MPVQETKQTRHLWRILGLSLCVVLAAAVLNCVLHPVFSPSGCPPDPVTVQSQPDTEQLLCIDDNTDALLWRLRVIESAQKRIAMSTFELGVDESGRDLMAALKAAADRGVQVQLLVDGGLGMLALPSCDSFEALASTDNVEIRLYNPMNLLTPWKINYRLHDKYLLADDNVYILGGRNAVNRFLGNYTDEHNVDRDLLICTQFPEQDTSQDQVWQYFTQIWDEPSNRSVTKKQNDAVTKGTQALDARYETLHQLYPEAFTDTDFLAETQPAHHIQLLHNPHTAARKKPQLWDALQPILASGKDITIQTPYIVCDKAMYNDLAQLAQGREMRILTNAIENGANPWGCADYLIHKNRILSTGTQVYEFAGGDSLHAKTILVDDHISLVGSFNLDMRSTYLNTEMLLCVDSPELNTHLRSRLDQDMAQSRHVMPDGTTTDGAAFNPPPFGLIKKLLYRVLSILVLPVRHLL